MTMPLTVRVTELEPVRDMLAALALLHAKSNDTVEIEVYHDDENPTLCPEWDRGCPGHIERIHICDECSVAFDPMSCEAVWSEWPCKTARLLGLTDG